MKPKIVVVGSFNTDLLAYCDRLPLPGETVGGHSFRTGPGGKGSNQAVAAARLGADVRFLGRIGRDMFAPLALDLWQQERIDTSFVVEDPDQPTGVGLVLVDRAGENSIVVVLGANLAVSIEDVEAAGDAIAQADVVLTQLEIRPEVTHHALAKARACGVITILNPAPATPLTPDTLSLADYLTPNQTELQLLAGTEGGSKDVASAASSLLWRDDQTIIVTLGSEGAQIVSRAQDIHVPGFEVKAVDTTGAGDAFNGALAVALAERRDLEDAVRFANATAALSVTKPATSPSMPTRHQVEQLLS